MVSNYADWDVNAKLPHGVDNVRKHLQEVDNVPLLVSLYTDATKATTAEIVEIFQDYSDTVIAIGLSHLPRNEEIFSSSDIAIGIDVFDEGSFEAVDSCSTLKGNSMAIPEELEFVCCISAHACAFRFYNVSALSHIPSVIEQSRAALEAGSAGTLFGITGCVSFALYVVLSACTVSTSVPFVPILGAVAFLQIVLPSLGFAISMTSGRSDVMKNVPPKNDQEIVFGRREGTRLYGMMLLRALLPAALPQLLHLIVFGELVLELEAELVQQECGGAASWMDIVRCQEMKAYTGPARIIAGIIVFGVFVVCVTVSSAGFVDRYESIVKDLPWERNQVWVWVVLFVLGCTAAALAAAVGNEAGEFLPGYFYALAAILPILCLVWADICKRPEEKVYRRAEKLRRLQFETRLGAWSPK